MLPFYMFGKSEGREKKRKEKKRKEKNIFNLAICFYVNTQNKN